MSVAMATAPSTNPYVGPRAYETGEVLYGRERELETLFAQLLSERIVLFYSPSGAGKTSLIRAALVPKLEATGFAVLPVIRVNREETGVPEIDQAVPNRYLRSCLHYLGESLPGDREPPIDVVSRGFADYLNWRRQQAGEPDREVLIFDQFEEIVTLDPTDQGAKSEFFAQVGEALRDERRWALFSLREDYIAALEPYRHTVPTRFRTRVRLDLLGADMARVAIREPADLHGREFEDAAAQKLVDDLRRVHVQRTDGTVEVALGPYVEPVQLQVVCRQLWNQLSADERKIQLRHIAALGDTDRALGDYYAETVATVAEGTGVEEQLIREWCSEMLITEKGIRGQVLRGADQSAGLPEQAVAGLVDRHLVRAEQRRGVAWLELAHDRLVAPVLASNAEWFENHLSPLQRQARLWEARGRTSGYLLLGETLAEAERWANKHPGRITSVEQEFLEAGRDRELAEEQARRLSSMRRAHQRVSAATGVAEQARTILRLRVLLVLACVAIAVLSVFLAALLIG
jgi:hypothetical protein